MSAERDGWTHYERARNTQAIYQIDRGDGRGFVRAIDPVPRTKLPRKWQSPGGLEGVSGWRSDLYTKRVGGDPGKRMLSVLNSDGNFQNEAGWARSYGEGTAFMDVLSNAKTGRVFEVRIREKHAGKWSGFVDYRDPEHWPPGYHGKVAACSSCHEGGQDNQPGSGGYGVGLISGSDTVFSDPIPDLER